MEPDEAHFPWWRQEQQEADSKQQPRDKALFHTAWHPYSHKSPKIYKTNDTNPMFPGGPDKY